MTKIKSYNFWVKLVSAVILIARIILAKFGYELDSALIIDIATLVAGLLVIMGIINEPTGITITYKECENNENIKGDVSMTEQIKNDLLAGVGRLTDAINTSNGSDISNVVQIITGMLDSISRDVENDVREDEEDCDIDEISVDADELKTVETLVIEPVEGEESIQAQEPQAEDEGEIADNIDEKIAELESKLNESNVVTSASDVQVSTAYSVVADNKDGVELIKNYILTHLDEIIANASENN